jgi:uncharacterized membrane protein YtjA (UPF0391 family)
MAFEAGYPRPRRCVAVATPSASPRAHPKIPIRNENLKLNRFVVLAERHPWPNGQALQTERRAKDMLRWAVVFLVVALIAAFLGFGGIAGAAAGMAQILFFVFLAVTVILFLLGLAGGRSVV